MAAYLAEYDADTVAADVRPPPAATDRPTSSFAIRDDAVPPLLSWLADVGVVLNKAE